MKPWTRLQIFQQRSSNQILLGNRTSKLSVVMRQDHKQIPLSTFIFACVITPQQTWWAPDNCQVPEGVKLRLSVCCNGNSAYRTMMCSCWSRKFQLECPIKTATKSISSTCPDLMGMADEEVGGRRDDWLLITFIQNDWLHGYKNKLSILCLWSWIMFLWTTLQANYGTAGNQTEEEK